uniref:ribosomal protein S8 n=1 Tax=Anemia phyllitidis TaxID=12940 RepID=UPI0021AC1BE8|nr:ribosomal protein S8 [Anemia phyllitidis]UUL71109.1 ribosomal protein S8 [Anemia phyllitidis]
MTNDMISTTLVVIRNANMRRGSTIRIPATGTTRSIGQILLEEGFVKSVAEHKENRNSFLDIGLKYRGRKKEPYITTARRISKPGLRIHSNHQKLPKVLSGMGIVILSTSSGLMTDREARQKKIGGEISRHIY